MSKRFIAVSAALLACVLCAEAQTNLQTFFDLGKDRKYITTTFEMFKGDKWGDTFFFIDHYYTNNQRQLFRDRARTQLLAGLCSQGSQRHD